MKVAGEGIWGTADIPPETLWKGFLWNLALIFWLAQVRAMLGQRSWTVWVSPQDGLSFLGVAFFPATCRAIQRQE